MIARAACWFIQERSAAAPPGVDPRSFALAVFEDLYETLSSLNLVETSVLVAPTLAADVEDLVWPGTECAQVDTSDAAAALHVLAGLPREGDHPDAVLVVAADVPDLPPMLIGKALRALGTAEVAYCAASGGGLVLLATRNPVPTWLTDLGPSLDSVSAVDDVHAAAPNRRAVAAVPGWHRLRVVDDLARLDPGLEGWDLTRAVLAGRPLRQPG